MEYEGTIVVITRDRFLMKSLDCPIMNLENGTGVFYKNFEDFMAKRSASGFMIKKPVEKAEKEEKPNSQLNQKEIRRKAAQDRARVKECEREIERLQEQLDQYQLDMQNPDIVSDHEKMAQLWQDMERDKQKMDELMDEWAELAERLEG